MTSSMTLNSKMEAYQYMVELSQTHASIMKNLLSEATVSFFTNTDQGKSGISKLIGYIAAFIDGLVKLIEFAINKIKALFKHFSARAKDVQMGNAEFIAKYGARLQAIEYAVVNFEGYPMNGEISSYGGEIGMMSGSNYSDLKAIILDGNKAFKDSNDISVQVARNRYSILGGNEFVTNATSISDNDFKNALVNKYYGQKGYYSYNVHDAVNMIKNYRIQYENIKHLNDLAQTNGNNDIRELQQLKNLFKSRTIQGRLGLVKDDLVEQLNMLSRYRTQTLQDSILAFGVILKFVDDMNLQAKAICIKALQEN